MSTWCGKKYSKTVKTVKTVKTDKTGKTGKTGKMTSMSKNRGFVELEKNLDKMKWCQVKKNANNNQRRIH